MNRLIAGAVMAGLLGAGCGSDLPTAPSEPITGVEWTLTRFQTDSEGTLPVPGNQSYTLEFDQDGVLSGQVDCNRCTGSYSAAAPLLSIGVLACTRAYCGDESLDNRYLSALQGATSYSRQGSELNLRYTGGVLSFQGS